MSAATYRGYKESGIGWIKKIPLDWDVLPLYAVASECDESNKGMLENNLLSLSYGRIVNKDINSNDGLLPESFETYQVVQPEDMVLRLTDLQNDKRSLRSAIVRERGIITSAYLALRPHGVFAEYFSYLLRSYDLTKVFYSMGGGLRQSMKFSDIKRMPVVIPSLEEQKAIVSFLDCETTKIDSLVAEQARLIELLKEKRKTEISHVMCVGLIKDRLTRMSDSGSIRRKIAKDWEVIRFKYLLAAPLMYGANEAAELDDPEWPRFIRITDIKENGELKTETFKSLPPDIAEPYLLKDEDILLARSGGTVGKSFIYRSQWGVCCFAGYLIRARLIKSKCLPEWFYYYSQTTMYWDFIQGEQIQATIQNVSAEKYANIFIPLPTIDEQIQIIDHIQLIDSKYRNLISEVEKSTVHLQERRSALIAAAVTGQIDVRSAAPELEAA